MFEIPFFIFSYIILSMGGLGNYLLGSGPLSAWKQILISFLLLYTLIKYHNYRALIPILCVVGAAVLVINTLALGRPIGATMYNIFFFIGWVPFFSLSQSVDFENRPKLGVFFVALMIVSAIGLWLQLTTNVLDFLKNSLEAQIRDQTGEAQRFFFVYVTSTGVMPTLAAFYCIALTARIGALWQVLALAALIVSAIATASLAAFIMLAFTLLMCTVVVKGWGRIILILFAGVFAIAAPLLQNDYVAKQLGRVTTNTSTSQSNQGRLELWRQSISLTATASPRELMIGRGVGTTNDNLGVDALYPNGESSYFQAIIEGGLLGLLLRLLPFCLLFISAASIPNRMMFWLYGTGVAICCAVAPVFALYGIQCGIGLVAGYASSRRRRLRRTSRVDGTRKRDPGYGKIPADTIGIAPITRSEKSPTQN